MRQPTPFGKLSDEAMRGMFGRGGWVVKYGQERATMTTVAILPEYSETGETVYQAVSAGKVSVGRTAGEALDAITAQMSAEETGMLVVVQNHAPDRFFTASQRNRLRELMDRWRAARDAGQGLSDAEQAELHALVDAEMEAAVLRSEAMAAPAP